MARNDLIDERTARLSGAFGHYVRGRRICRGDLAVEGHQFDHIGRRGDQNFVDGAQCHLRDHRLVELLDLLFRARECVDGVPRGHVPVVPVERDHRLRRQVPLNDGFLRVWPVYGACLVRESLPMLGSTLLE
jgi:hypothetical protein